MDHQRKSTEKLAGDGADRELEASGKTCIHPFHDNCADYWVHPFLHTHAMTRNVDVEKARSLERPSTPKATSNHPTPASTLIQVPRATKDLVSTANVSAAENVDNDNCDKDTSDDTADLPKTTTLTILSTATDTDDPATACASLEIPTSIWLNILKHTVDPHALSSLALVCKALLPLAEHLLYVHTTLYSPRALKQFLATLTAAPAKAEAVRTLRLSWDGSEEPVPLDLARTLGGVLQRLPHATAFSFAPAHPHVRARLADVLMYDTESSVVVPRSVHRLATCKGILHRLTEPRPPLVVLSLRLCEGELAECIRLAGWYGATLKRLALEVRCESPLVGFRRENPAWVCAALETPRLEHLELRTIMQGVCSSFYGLHAMKR